MCVCLTFMPWQAVTIYVNEMLVKCFHHYRLQQEEALRCVWTQEGQEDTVHMHQVQEECLQHRVKRCPSCGA